MTQMQLQKHILAALIASLASFAPIAYGQTPPGNTPAPAGSDPQRALLNTYCVTCHNSRLKTGGLALDTLNLQSAPDDAHIWEKALRKLRGRLMPPPGARQPAQKDVDSFVAWMENALDQHPKGPVAHQQRHDSQLRCGAGD